MSVAQPVAGAPAPAPPEEDRRGTLSRYLLIVLGVFLLVSLVRVLTGAHSMTANGTLFAALVAAIPIALAGLGGLWSERAGVVNIGLEGMMILGTLGAGYFGYHYGALAGVVGAMAFGLLGALLHGVVTVYVGVDHIVSGVAVNIIAAGLAAFLAKAWFSGLPGGGPTQSPPLPHVPEVPLDFLRRALAGVEERHWFVVSDLAALVRGVTRDLSLLTLVALALFVLTAWVLWRTPFGLRLRSVGEAPSAAESLGVNVYRYKLLAVLASGALAGLGGAYLALVSVSGYQNGMTLGLGYIGLAAMIFGNWRPTMLLVGALLFGYTQSIHLRGATAGLHALLLVIAIVLFAAAAWAVYRQAGRKQGLVLLAGLLLGAALVVRRTGLLGLEMNAFTTARLVASVVLLAAAAWAAYRLAGPRAGLAAGGGVAFLLWFVTTDSVPRNFTGMAPYVTTLLVLAAFSQKLRMPAADGQVYRKGSAG